MIDSEIIKGIREIAKQDEGTGGYDTTAEIVRVEGDTAWAHIPGGVDETPVAMTINCNPGDTVRVRVDGGRAWIVGNETAPPTDDKTAKDAKSTAYRAAGQAEQAAESATKAIRSALTAAQAAEEAKADAIVAHSAAVAARESADEANANAISATNSANNALGQLSTVENVVGTLNWIAEHGEYSATEDTEVIAGKTYYIRTGAAGDYSYIIVTNPESNPSEAGYYELTNIDESVTNYIKTHLVLTDDGLYILLDESNGYKLKLTNSGASIIDAAGQEVAVYSSVTTVGPATGAHVEIAGNRMSFRVGDNEVAYIAIDPDTQESIFYMTKAIVVQDLHFGEWKWSSRANGNLALRWVGFELEEELDPETTIVI